MVAAAQRSREQAEALAEVARNELAAEKYDRAKAEGIASLNSQSQTNARNGEDAMRVPFLIA